MGAIAVPHSKYAHICRGYMTLDDERRLSQPGTTFGCQLGQLAILSKINNANGDLDQLLVLISVPNIFSQATAVRMKADGYSPSFILALQLCALSGVDLVRFSDSGYDIPDIAKARSGTDEDTLASEREESSDEEEEDEDTRGDDNDEDARDNA